MNNRTQSFHLFLLTTLIFASCVGSEPEPIEIEPVEQEVIEPVEEPEPELHCLDFEDLSLGTRYLVNDSFITDGIQIKGAPFQNHNGNWVNGGFVEVGDIGDAGGSGQEMTVNNILLQVELNGPSMSLKLSFGDKGENLNIDINGEFFNFDNFADIDGAVIGNVDIVVIGQGNDQGVIELSGTINSFALGGNELALDDLCLEIPDAGPEPEPQPFTCIDFEDLALGLVYGVSDSFTTAGVQISGEDFQLGNGGWITDGFAKVVGGGNAGGSGNEMNVNNILLRFNFSEPMPGLTLKFGEYGENLNIDVNNEFVNFEDFVELDGAVIGNVDILVINGYGDDLGEMMLAGTVNSLALGGVELYLDDICLSE